MSGPAVEQGKTERQVAEAGWKTICEIVAEIQRSGRLTELRAWLPANMYEELEIRHEFEFLSQAAIFRYRVHRVRDAFIEKARRHLASFDHREWPPTGDTLLGRLRNELEKKEEELLHSAVAWELRDLAGPVALRAAQIHDSFADRPDAGNSSTEEINRLLEESVRCYLYGLFAACALLCRSVLEQVLRNYIFTRTQPGRRGPSSTIPALLRLIENSSTSSRIGGELPQLAREIDATAVRATHQGLLSEDEARACLQTTRRTLLLLLRPVEA